MDIFLVATRLILAAILGAVIGIEREIKNRAAGFRTHIIVSVGACLIMLIGIDGIGKFSSDTARDTARIAGQVISGIGFFGCWYYSSKKECGNRINYGCDFVAICGDWACGWNWILRRGNHCDCDLSCNFDFTQ